MNASLPTGVARHVFAHPATGVAAVALLSAAFAVTYAMELKYDALEAFVDYDVLFDSDPNNRVVTIAEGYGNRNLIHPHFANLFTFPIRLAARGMIAAGVTELDRESVRRALGLLVVPAVSGATLVLVLAMFRRLGRTLAESVLGACLVGASFSQLIYGSVPDHFAVGGFSMAVAYLLAVDDLRREGPFRRGAWLATGVFTLGITITNLFWVGVLAFACLLKRGLSLPVAAARVGLYGATAVLVAYLTAIPFAAYFSGTRVLLDVDRAQTFVNSFINEDPSPKSVRAAAALANTIAPASIGRRHVLDESRKQDMLTLEGSISPARTVLCLILLVTGAAMAIRKDAANRFLASASLAIVVGNLVMHSFFGNEIFLYSQIWLTPMVVLLSGNLLVPEGGRSRAIVGFGLLVVLVASNNAARLSEVFAILSRGASAA